MYKYIMYFSLIFRLGHCYFDGKSFVTLQIGYNLCIWRMEGDAMLLNTKLKSLNSVLSIIPCPGEVEILPSYRPKLQFGTAFLILLLMKRLKDEMPALLKATRRDHDLNKFEPSRRYKTRLQRRFKRTGKD